MEKLIHSPKLIFNFNYKYNFQNYNIEEKFYVKLIDTINYIKNSIYKLIESKFLDDEQNIEIHRWLSSNSYLEYRLFECENSTDIVEFDIFEDTESTYQNLLVFQTRDQVDNIYNKLIIGNDYFGSGFVLTEDFEWNLYDECNMIDIPRKIENVEEIEHIKISHPNNIDIDDLIQGFFEMIILD